jgi:hypothetical protein
VLDKLYALDSSGPRPALHLLTYAEAIFKTLHVHPA